MHGLGWIYVINLVHFNDNLIEKLKIYHFLDSNNLTYSMIARKYESSDNRTVHMEMHTQTRGVHI